MLPLTVLPAEHLEHAPLPLAQWAALHLAALAATGMGLLALLRRPPGGLHPKAAN